MLMRVSVPLLGCVRCRGGKPHVNPGETLRLTDSSAANDMQMDGTFLQFKVQIYHDPTAQLVWNVTCIYIQV